MKKQIEELARELLKNILEKYHNRGEWDTRSLSKMVEDELKNYNEEVRYLIENALFNILGSFYFENTNKEIAVTPVLLSEMLYKNAKEVSKTATKILRDGIKAKKTIDELARELYEGYGFRDKEPLDLIDKYALPKYIKDELTRPKNLKKIMKQIEKLKTKPLRIAYKNIFRELEKMSYDGLEKAMYVAVQEKARYYANRIAQTEISRASNSKWAKEMLEDEEIEFVKYRLSTAHRIKDICDFYAHLDLGYGEGIYPKSEMRTLPLHPHCSCTYDPYYRKVKGKRKSWNEAVKETMNKFSEYEQRQILGSKDKLQEFKQSKDIEEIFNSIRPKYPIKKYVDLFDKMSFKKDVAMDIKQMLDEIKNKKKLTKNKIKVGELSNEIIEFLREKEIPVHTKEIYLNHKGLSHLARESKKKRGAGLSEDDILRIPEIIHSPSAIFIEDTKDKLNLLYCDSQTKKCIKIVVDTKFIYKGEKITLIKTAGYINSSDMKNPNFKLIFGDWDF